MNLIEKTIITLYLQTYESEYYFLFLFLQFISTFLKKSKNWTSIFVYNQISPKITDIKFGKRSKAISSSPNIKPLKETK